MMPDSDDDKRVLGALKAYGRAHRHPDRPAFIAHEPQMVGDKDVKGKWEGTPASYRPGCYVLFSDAGVLLYVGKASHAKSVGDRLVRFRYKGSDWLPRPAYVRIIEVAEPFEAPSLEEFLICTLHPLHNKHGAVARINA